MGQHLQGLAIAAGNGDTWRHMLVLGTLPAIALWIGMRLMPESSRWYASKQRYHEAIGALKRIRHEPPDDVAAEVAEMVEVQRSEVVRRAGRCGRPGPRGGPAGCW